MKVFGPIEPELQVHDPSMGGFVRVAEGPAEDMIKLGKKKKKANPSFIYRVVNHASVVTWESQ